MLNSQKIAAAVAAGILGGFGLLGFSATSATADDGADACVKDGDGIHCVQSQICTGGGEVDCSSTVIIRGEKVES